VGGVEVADLITLPRAVVQQALAFTMRNFATVRDFEAARAVLHDTLKAALAQPEQEPISQLKPNATTRLQDPGAYDRGVLTGLRQALAICSDWEDFTADRLAGDIQDAINNQMALEQPEQEPVAWWIVSKTTDEEFVSVRPNDWSDINWQKHPLYTHPPRREWRSLSKAKGVDA
jgi:hypothetical protein